MILVHVRTADRLPVGTSEELLQMQLTDAIYGLGIVLLRDISVIIERTVPGAWWVGTEAAEQVAWVQVWLPSSIEGVNLVQALTERIASLVERALGDRFRTHVWVSTHPVSLGYGSLSPRPLIAGSEHPRQCLPGLSVSAAPCERPRDRGQPCFV